jgi:hypothetical protein
MAVFQIPCPFLSNLWNRALLTPLGAMRMSSVAHGEVNTRRLFHACDICILVVLNSSFTCSFCHCVLETCANGAPETRPPTLSLMMAPVCPVSALNNNADWLDINLVFPSASSASRFLSRIRILSSG